MRILHIAYYTFKRKFKGCIPSLILLPLVLILILGNSLKVLYEPGRSFTNTLAVYSSDSKEFQSISDFLKKNYKFNKHLKVTWVKQKEKALAALKERKYYGVFDVRDKRIYINDENSKDTSLIHLFINSYNFSGNKVIIDSGIKNINSNSSNRKPSAMDYYAVTMLVMILWYGGEYGIEIVSDDKDIINRTVSLPMSRQKDTIGKMLGIVAIMFFVSTVIIVFSKFVYKAYWGNNYILLAPVMLLFSFLTVNVGMAICLIVKDGGTAGYIMEILVVVSTFLGGGYLNTKMFSDDLQKLNVLSPSYAEHSILFKIIYGYGQNLKIFYLEIIVLVLLMFSITMFSVRRRVK